MDRRFYGLDIAETSATKANEELEEESERTTSSRLSPIEHIGTGKGNKTRTIWGSGRRKEKA